MTDHRGGEKKRMQPIFSSNNLVEHEIAPDGHCLFSSFADGLASASIPLSSSSSSSSSFPNIDATPKVEPYKIVRRTAADYMLSHGDDFAGFLEEPLEEYARKIRDTAEWGGQLELSALANAYGVEVRIVQDGRTEVIVPSGEMGGEEGSEKEKKTVWLAYYRHGFGLGEHYNALRRKEVAT
jgi:OTU domain-containing protein 6